MDRNRIVHIVIALAAIALQIVVEVFGSKLDSGTKASAIATLSIILVQVRPWIGGSGGSTPKDPPTVPPAVLVLALAVFLAGCSPEAKAATIDDAQYEDALRSCRETAKKSADPCPEYVKCRKRVATEFRRAFDGICLDGGT